MILSGGYCWDERLVDDDEVKEHEDPRGEQ